MARVRKVTVDDFEKIYPLLQELNNPPIMEQGKLKPQAPKGRYTKGKLFHRIATRQGGEVLADVMNTSQWCNFFNWVT